MARAAGWTETTAMATTPARSQPRKLATITVNKYETPTAQNAGCAYSVGIMNLTRDEANALADYATILQRDRSMTAMEARERAIAEGRRTVNITGADVRPFASGGAIAGLAPNPVRMEAIARGVREGTISVETATKAMQELSGVVRRQDWRGANKDEAQVYGSPAWEARTKQLRDEAFAELEGGWEEVPIDPDDPDGLRPGADVRQQYLAQRNRDEAARREIEKLKAKEAEARAVPRNRFSGLDIE